MIRLAAAFAVLFPLMAGSAGAQGITGAGSTFAYPVLAAWSQAYQKSEADAEFQPVGLGLDYEPVGSQSGVMRVKEKAVDFGATDVPLGPQELDEFKLAQFPIVIGGVVAAINIEGVRTGQLKLTGDVLADIYLGRIARWSDPAIKALNPDLPLPDAAIVPLHRADGSGTTFNFTNYLSKFSPDFKSRIGEGLTVKWPEGPSAKGNDGIAQLVRGTDNSIAYVEYAQARRSGLAHALLRNRAGAFVAPNVASFQAAAASADWGSARNFQLLLNDAAGEGAYPLVATTFAVVPRENPPSGRLRAVIAYLDWSFRNGAAPAEKLGYVALPGSLVSQINAYWQSELGVD